MFNRSHHLFLVAALALGVACQVEADVEQSAEEDCGEATLERFADQSFCVYQMPIIETRFDCPSFASHQHRVGEQDIAVCAEQAQLPEGFEQWVDEQIVNDPMMPPEEMMEPDPVVEPPVVTPDPDPVLDCEQGVGVDCADDLTASPQPRYNGQAVAVRLAEMMWRDVPDAELSQAAATGGLDTRTGIIAQVTRMMQDPRFEANLDDFWTSYLQLEHLTSTGVGLGSEHVNDSRYTATLEASMLSSTLRTISAVTLRDEEDVRDVWTTQTAMLNADLAPMFPGVMGVMGSDFSEVQLPASRRGVLSHPSLLSHGSSSSGAISLHGVYVNALLCATVPAPPDDAEPAPSVPQGLSERESHDFVVSEPSCAACHAQIDPPGHALHGFDLMGAPRTVDGRGMSIDDSGVFEGVVFSSYDDFAGLLRDDARFSSCVTLRLVEHMTGSLANVDAEALAPRVSQHTLAQGDFTIQGLITAIATSDPMLYRP